MARRFAWFAAFAGLLFAGSGAARFLHLHAAHVGPSVASANTAVHTHCHHHKTHASETPAPAPRHSSDHCETCFLIAAAFKGVAPVLTILPAADPLVTERIDVPNATIVAISRLDAASQRGPPAIST